MKNSDNKCLNRHDILSNKEDKMLIKTRVKIALKEKLMSLI